MQKTPIQYIGSGSYINSPWEAHLALPNAPTEPQEPNSRDGDAEALISLSFASALVELLNNLTAIPTGRAPTLTWLGALPAAGILIALWRKHNDR